MEVDSNDGTILFVGGLFVKTKESRLKNPAKNPALVREVMGHADVRDTDRHLIELATPAHGRSIERADKLRPRPQRGLWETPQPSPGQILSKPDMRSLMDWLR